MSWNTVRSAVLFGGGLAGITAVTVASIAKREAPDPSLLLLFSAMVGLPAFLGFDSKSRERAAAELEETEEDRHKRGS